MSMLNGAVLAIKSMVSGLIRQLVALMSPGAKTTCAPTVTGVEESPVAQEASQPAQTEQKRKRSRAQSTTAEASPKRGRTSVKRTAIQPGQQQETPASKTRQPAKRARKPKQ